MVQVRHLGTYTCGGCATYREHVGEDGKDAWTEFLAALIARPGWSVSRLARESGMDRSHIHRMMRGETKTVTVETVRMIAKGGQASLAEALHAARSRTSGEPVGTSEENDPEIRAIMESNLSDSTKRDLVAHVRRRQQQLREEVDMLIESAKRG